MIVAPWAVGGVGGTLIVATLVDAFEVMLLPRRVHRPLRFVRLYFRGTWGVWTGLARRAMPAGMRGTFLSVYGPLSMIGLFVVWIATLVTGFALVHWALASAAPDAPTLLTQLYFSGETFFTLGYGDVTAHTRAGRVLAVAEAGIGFGLIAVVIGYLPVLYQLFSRREAYVIRLDARAGSPPTAAELLARHAVSAQGLASLRELLVEWERWAAELLESHLSYPMLAYYRSQHDNESWLAALTAVLDVCTLLTLGLCDATGDATGANVGAGVASELPTFQARMTFATGRLAVVEMAGALNSAPRTADGADRGTTTPDRLPAIALERLLARLAEVGLVIDESSGSVPQRLDTLRATYEPFVEAMAERLLLPLPRWVAYDGATDNWQQSVGGADAREVLDAAEAADVDTR